MITNVNAIGLVYDGFGVVVLGAPGFFCTKQNIKADSKSSWDFSPNTVRSLLLLRMDTAAGSILLFLGFFFQLLAALNVNLPLFVCTLLWIFAVGYAATYWLYLRGTLHHRWSEEMIEQLKREAEGK